MPRENHTIPIAGNLGNVRILKRIQERCCWKRIRSDIEDNIKSCKLRQENKALRKIHRTPMPITITSSAPFQRPYNGHSWAITMGRATMGQGGVLASPPIIL